ncbi:MAG: glycosyltransferase, partial [Proteobacteria bacterium]|nr:glycosyltransferase [Pseudomonadota bacterium]
MIRLTVGFDQREAISFHTFVQSVLDCSSEPISVTPLVLSALPGYEETHQDGSNTFIYSRFLTPWLMEFQGWAIYADGDMVCRADLKELWDSRDERFAVMVVKHDYQTKAEKKYLGNRNENYPRKNWSSVILWNCGHPKNKVLDPAFVMGQGGAFLHRFSWLEDSDIGELAKEWNWLAIEYPPLKHAKLIHYTLGAPCFKEYRLCDLSEHW